MCFGSFFKFNRKFSFLMLVLYKDGRKVIKSGKVVKPLYNFYITTFKSGYKVV